MSAIFTDVAAWFIATLLAAAMLAGWTVGWRVGQRAKKERGTEPPGRFGDASLALLGLVLAFTFSLALAKHDQRRQMIVADSNAIGDFYTCASLLKDPTRKKLQDVIRDYAEHRLALAGTRLDEATIEEKLGEIQQIHDRMQALVGEALEEGTPAAAPLVNTLNGVTSSHAARLAAFRDRLPTSIVVLLFVATVVSMVLIGNQQGASGDWHPGATVGFAALVSLVVWVTLDLNQPERGAITVSQEPMRRVLSGMGK